jgi:hypothetical protein
MPFNYVSRAALLTYLALGSALGPMGAKPLDWSSATSSTSDECPDACAPDLQQFGGGRCVIITMIPGAKNDGTVTEGCVTNCTQCWHRAEVNWDCSGCTEGCTWVWGWLNHGLDGNPLGPGAVGQGTGGGRATPTLATSCDGPGAFWAISIAGVQYSIHVTCSC